MKLAETRYDNSETGCCAKVEPGLWDDKLFEWHDRSFLKDHIRAFLHIPLDFGSVISRDHAAIEQAAAYPEQPLWLTEEVSPWGSDVYVAVDRDIPDRTMVRLSGTFVTKVFEGPYRHIGKWLTEMEHLVAARGRRCCSLSWRRSRRPEPAAGVRNVATEVSPHRGGWWCPTTSWR